MKIFTLKSLLFANFDVKTYEMLYRRTLLLHIILLASMIGFGLFFIINSFVLSNYFISFLNLSAFIVELYAFKHIRKTGTIEFASFIVTFNLFIFLLLLAYIQEGRDFTFIWTIFFPITAILLNGSKKGLLYSFVFYAILFTIGFLGIGVWQDGQWNSVSYIRLVFASLILVYVLFLIEQSFEKSYIALENIRKKEKEYLDKLHISSITDHLTGIYNRRELDPLFQKAFHKAKNTNKYFALFILDLDLFKEYNDNYGHDKGDNVLCRVASVLKQNLDNNLENIFRLGGEEFAGIVIDDNKEKIFNYIENIRDEIEKLDITHKESSSGKLTASFGVCIINEYDVEDFDVMYKCADEFLYESKEKGRNVVTGDIVKLATV